MILPVLSWLLLALLLSAAGYPLLAKIRDEDVYGLARPLTMLLVTYLLWLTGHLTPVSPATAYLSLSAVVAAAALLILKTGAPLPKREEVLRTEGVFVAVFILLLVTRLYSPEISYTGGEKFMDYAFMQSLSHAQMPPGDPWMAGEPMFYYYLGYLSAAAAKLLTGVPWEHSFNLVVPLFAGTAASTAYSVGRLLKTRLLPLLLLSGSLYGAVDAVYSHIPFAASEFVAVAFGRPASPAFDYFDASRVIPGTINEFPLFTFIHADPHPHLLSIPFQLLVIGLLLLHRRTDGDHRLLMLLPVLALSLGALYPLNTWDYPTYLLLTAGILLYPDYRSGAKHLAAVAPLSLLLFLPYHLAIDTSRGIGLVHHRTEMVRFLGANGILLALVFLYLYRRLERREFGATATASLILLLAGIPLDFQLLALLPIGAAALLVARREGGGVVPLALLAGTGIAVGVELLRVEGVYSGELERMNTVFKLYIQLWILWSLPAASALQDLAEGTRRELSGSSPRIWTAALILLLIPMLAYPVAGVWDRADGFHGEPELSGEAYVESWRPAEAEALDYLDTQKRGVVIEAPGRAYRWTSVAGSLTKHSTVIGWVNHEVGWREDDEPVRARVDAVDRFFETGDTDVLDRYGVDYVYVGPAERERYPGARDRFEGELERLFGNEAVRIYRAP